MTNEELLAALKTEIGWLRNEIIRMRSDYEQQSQDVKRMKEMIERLDLR